MESRFREAKKDLEFLSEEFDTLGLPTLDLNQPPAVILDQIISSSHLLVNLCRKSLSDVRHVNVNNQFKNAEKVSLEKKIESLKSQINKQDNKVMLLERQLNKSQVECNDLKNNISMHSREKEDIKRYYTSKYNESVKIINKLKLENEHLQTLCKNDIGKYTSKDDVVFDFVKKSKIKEKIYKETIEKLEKNNKLILEENIKLREELCLTLCNQKD